MKPLAGREISAIEQAWLMCVTAGQADFSIEFRDKRAGEVERNFAFYDLAEAILGFCPASN